MDGEGFRAYLKERDLSAEAIEASVSIAAEFEQFRQGSARSRRQKENTADVVARFSGQMVERGMNTQDRYFALFRYGRFIRDDALFVAALELVDGAEVLGNLHRKLGEAIGEPARDAIFEGIDVPPLGTPNARKPPLTERVMQRLEASVDPATCKRIIGSGLRDLDDAAFFGEKAKYEQAGGIDAYLERKGADFIASLEKHRDEGTLYFTQPVDDAVIEYVRDHAEIRAGVRRGRVLFEAKIPYQTTRFLAAKNQQERAYHYCHCPWVKDSLRDGPSRVSPTFCHCSAAFHKRPYEVIFGQPLRADVVETVLRGDLWCRFAIHLPERVI